MPRMRHKPEKIVTKLRQVDVLVSQGQGNVSQPTDVKGQSRPMHSAPVPANVRYASVNGLLLCC